MKVIIDNQVFDTNSTAIILAWDNDRERQMDIDNLSKMKPQSGGRLYAIYDPERDGPGNEIIHKAIKLLNY